MPVWDPIEFFELAPNMEVRKLTLVQLTAKAGVASALALALVAMEAPSLRADDVEAVDRSALRVCADPASLPFSNQKRQGFENKIADLLASKLKVPVRYTWYPDSVGFLRNTLIARRCDLVVGIAAGAELVLNTNPYYRSTYVVVTRRKDNLTIDHLSDPKLRTLKIGLTAGTPPANVIAQLGLMQNVRPYPLVVDTRFDQPGKVMIDDLAKNEIDAAILWGPIGGYYAKQHGDQMSVTPLLKESKSVRMDFYITMGVRPNEAEWKRQVNGLIKDNEDRIVSILKDYGIPLLDAQGKPLP
jgi:quinoprotein dehydrogenase-associated probable ABC transporter substrate-binding protein